MNQYTSLSNKEILDQNLTAVNGSNEIWKDFLEQSANKPLRWVSSAKDKFDSIDKEDDKLYVFTWAYPTYFIYKIITENFVWDDGDMTVNIKNICELKLADNIEPCFWEKVVNAIRARNDNKFRQLVSLSTEKQKGQGIFKSIPTEKLANDLKKELEDNNSENHERYLSFGRIFLLKTIMVEAKTFVSKRPREKYVLYMFVDDHYFQEVFGTKKGLQYEK